MIKGNKFESNKKLISRREFLAESGAVVAAIALTACGSNSTTNISTSVTSTPLKQTSITPSTSQTPKYGGTLRVLSGVSSNNKGWPADFMVDTGTIQISCDTLLRGDNKGNIIPWLAESYKIADDRMSVTFNLRKGVKFHDGSDFNADAAKWNLDNFINAKLQDHWASVDVIDDSTIRLNFTQWQNTLLSSFVEPTFPAFMVSKTAFEKNGLDWMRAHPVGTGPFIFDSFNPDVSYKVVRNPDYWVKGKPYLDEIDYIIIANTNTQMMAIKAGEGDVASATLMDMAGYAAAGFKVKAFPVTGVNALIPDTANADSPWANQKVREAVEYAIDKEVIAKAFSYGYWKAPYQIVPPACTLAYNPDFTLGRKFDLDKAKQLLAEAGYSKGFETTIIVMPTANRNVVYAMQDNLDKAGIKVNFDYPEMGKWATNYMNPMATWHNAALYYGVPTVTGVDFAAGLQFLFSNLGQSWLRTPELNNAYQAFLSSPTVEIEKVRAVTDMITKEALIIPTDESGSAGSVMRNDVFVSYGERSSEMLSNAEDWWLNT